MSDEYRLQIEEGLAELADATWPWRVVDMCAFAHATYPACAGWTYTVDGYARCGNCDWSISARTDLGDDRARGRFAIASLAAIGLVFALIDEQQRTDHPIVEIPGTVVIRIDDIDDAFDTSDVRMVTPMPRCDGSHTAAICGDECVFRRRK